MEKINGSDDKISVSFTYVNTGRQAKFPVPKDTKFYDIVRNAYEKLGEQRKEGDNIFCMNGEPLDEHMDKTLQIIVEDVCKEARFDIKGRSGGAIFYFD